jgi:hypothetical protein
MSTCPKSVKPVAGRMVELFAKSSDVNRWSCDELSLAIGCSRWGAAEVINTITNTITITITFTIPIILTIYIAISITITITITTIITITITITRLPLCLPLCALC